MNGAADLSAWLNLTQQAVLQLDPKNSVLESFWKEGARSDGRVFAEARRYTFQHGVLNHAAGSALVKCTSLTSNTVVLSAVTLLVGQPSAVAPNQGDVVVTVAYAGTNSGSSTTNIPQLQSFLQRCLEENVDLEQLVINEGKLAYRLAVTVSLIENCGSVTDACLASAVAALLDTQLPVQTFIEGGVVYTDKDSAVYKPLRMPVIPCSLTAAGARFGRKGTSESTSQHHWIVDPDSEEQKVQESVVTVVVNASPSSDEILAIHFCPTGTSPAITTIELARIIHMATGHAADLFPILKRPCEAV